MSEMWTIAISRWTLARLARQPATWVLVPLLAVVWPMVEFLSPLGVTTTRQTEVRALYEVAFLGALAAAMAAQDLIARGEALLSPLGPGRRSAAEHAAHAAAALLYLLPVLITAWSCQAPRSAYAISRLPSGLLLTVLHLSALAQVLRRLPLPQTLRLAALPLVGWALPSLAAASAPGLGFLAAMDTGRHLELAVESHASDPQRITACLPIIGWSVLGLLLTRPHPHALRRPR